MHLAIERATTQTKPTCTGFRNLDFSSVRAGGLRLYSREFYSLGLGAGYKITSYLALIGDRLEPAAIQTCVRSSGLAKLRVLKPAFAGFACVAPGCMEHGSDWRSNDQPPEELNRIQQGEDYGWPFCWGDRQPDVYLPAQPQGMTKEEFCATTQPPVLTYTAHSAPLDFLFYTASQFPQEYQGDAFVTMRGSWNRNPAVGYKVVRVRFQNGQPVAFEDFITGFLNEQGTAQFGRPVGLTTTLDGSLLFTDDTNGVIYRVSYQ